MRINLTSPRMNRMTLSKSMSNHTPHTDNAAEQRTSQRSRIVDKTNLRMYDALEQTSDYFESSLPLTYDFFIKKGFHDKHGNQDGNSFDSFIKINIPFFTFIIDQFYSNRRPSSLQLNSLTDEKMLHHLDKAILEYLIKGGKSRLDAVREIYVYLLESWVIKLALNK